MPLQGKEGDDELKDGNLDISRGERRGKRGNRERATFIIIIIVYKN